MSDKEPHLTIQTQDGTVHSIRCSVIEDIINGKIPPAYLLCIDGGNDIARAILREWYGGPNGM